MKYCTVSNAAPQVLASLVADDALFASSEERVYEAVLLWVRAGIVPPIYSLHHSRLLNHNITKVIVL